MLCNYTELFSINTVLVVTVLHPIFYYTLTALCRG